MAYCTITDVEALTIPGYNGGVYSSTTKPSDAQVNTLIELISSEINLTVVAAGYTLPILGSDALSFLRLANSYGAGSLAEQANSQQGNPEISGHIKDLWAKYQDMLNTIRTVPGALGTSELPKASGTPRSMWTSNIADGTDENISDISPFVRRDTNF